VFTAHQCKRGYEAAKAKRLAAKTEDEKQIWLNYEQRWLTRWRYLESQGLC
jgi:hypothetical protein